MDIAAFTPTPPATQTAHSPMRWGRTPPGRHPHPGQRTREAVRAPHRAGPTPASRATASTGGRHEQRTLEIGQSQGERDLHLRIAGLHFTASASRYPDGDSRRCSSTTIRPALQSARSFATPASVFSSRSNMAPTSKRFAAHYVVTPTARLKGRSARARRYCAATRTSDESRGDQQARGTGHLAGGKF